MIEKAARTIVSAISLGVFWRIAPFDQRDHPVEEALAGLGGDLDDDPVGEHARAAGDARVVAAGLADHRGALAGDGRLRRPRRRPRRPRRRPGSPARPRRRRGRRRGAGSRRRSGRSPTPRPVEPEGRRVLRGSRGGCRPGPCRGPRPAPRRSWRRGPSAAAGASATPGRRSGRSPRWSTIDWTVTIAVRTVPTSTRNMTGLRIMFRGSSMTNDRQAAMRTSAGSKSLSCPRLAALDLEGLGFGGGPLGQPRSRVSRLMELRSREGLCS